MTCSVGLFVSEKVRLTSMHLLYQRINDTPRAQLISDVAVQSVCFSDHHLVTCHLGVPPPLSAVTTSFTYRPLRRIDKQAFCQVTVTTVRVTAV